MKTQIGTLKDQAAEAVEALFKFDEGYLDNGIWYSFREFLIFSDSIDSLRTDPSFKEGVYIVCEIVMNHNNTDYIIDNTGSAYSAMLKLIEALDMAGKKGRKYHSVDEASYFIIKTKLRIIAEITKALSEAPVLTKAA